MGNGQDKAKQGRPAKSRNFLHNVQVAQGMTSRLTGLHHTGKEKIKNCVSWRKGEAREAARRLEQVLLIC